MNRNRTSFRTLVLVSGIVAGLMAVNLRADDVVISQFNNSAAVTPWHFDFGSTGISNSASFSTNDAAGSASSGSLKLTVGYSPTAVQAAFTANLTPATNGSTFTVLEFDVKVDGASALDKFGNAMYFQLVTRNGSGYAYTKQFQNNITVVSTNNGWRHIVFSPLATPIDDIRAITLDLYDNNYTNSGTAIVYVDNIKFTKPTPVTETVVSTFDDDTSLTRWRFDYGGVTHNIEFDATQDAKTNAASGSMKVTLGFDAASLNASGNNKGAVTIDLPAAIDGSGFLSMEMDLKIDAGSATDASTNSGYFQMVIRNSGSYTFNSQFGGNVTTNSGWRHIRVSPISGAANNIRAITLELYGGAGLTGNVVFHVDNIKFTTAVAPPPPPSLSVQRPIRGLNLIPTSGQFQRQNLASVDSGFGWMGSTTPVTYALTIGSYPDATHNGFQTHIFLVAGSVSDNAPDYTDPNVIFLDIQSLTGGGAQASFRYKTNEPAGNTFLYSGGTLGNVTNASPVGTWTLTFSQDTNAVVTAPGGGSKTFALPAAAAALFNSGVTVYLGDQPNNGPNVGQTAVINRFKITKGATTLLDDDFSSDTKLDDTKWIVSAGDAKGVVLIGPDAAFWLSWTTPDAGFSLQTTTTVADTTSWVDPGWVVSQMGSVKRALVRAFSDSPDPSLLYEPDASKSFFRLSKPSP